LVAADSRTALSFSLSPGQAHDAEESRYLLQDMGRPNTPVHLLMDRAYEGNETRQLALDLIKSGKKRNVTIPKPFAG